MPVGDGPFGIMPPSRGNGGEAERSARVGRGLERPVRETQERTERRRPRGGLVRIKKKDEGLHWPPASPPPLGPLSETPPFIELSSSSRRRASAAAPVSSALARSRRNSSPVRRSEEHTSELQSLA